MTDLTPETLAQWREEAGLGVCSDPRREFGRDYRIVDLLDALDAEKARAEQAEQRLANRSSQHEQALSEARQFEGALSRVLADVEALAAKWDGYPDNLTVPLHRRDELRALVAKHREGRATGVELTCDACSKPYAVWFADNEVWNYVMGGPGAQGDPGGMLCPRCFALKAEVAYGFTAIWRLSLTNEGRAKHRAGEGG